MDKIVRLGTVPRFNGGLNAMQQVNIYCRIQYQDGRLSISGVEGPKGNGDCVGSCGQIVMSMDVNEITPAPRWTRDTIAQFIAIWNRWHLNDMNAGTPKQMAFLRKLGMNLPYNAACGALKMAGLHPDNGYRYGSAWLREDVPDDVITLLAKLPDTDQKPAWV